MAGGLHLFLGRATPADGHDGRDSPSLPVLLALYGTWAIGAAALNPLPPGDEGAMLPVTLTSEIRGAEFVRGHVLAVATVGLPILVAVTGSTGVLSPLGPSKWIPLTIASAIAYQYVIRRFESYTLD